MTVRSILKAFLRMAAMFWLATMVASPAVAELGCIQESGTHLQPSSAVSQAAVSAPDEQSGQEEGKAVGHCCFSHGACSGALLGSAEPLEQAPTETAFTPTVAITLATIATAGQERPPKA